MRLLLLGLTAATLWAQPEISGARIREHVKFLASDLLEGRGVGTRGGELATAYLATQMALAGLQPAGDNGTFFQRVDLVGVEPQSSAKLTLGSTALTWAVDFVGNTQQQKSLAEFNAEAVFVGHGITAPEFGWDDYAGVDVKGKVVVLFTNEPPSDDPKFFGGKALTYYGRWTYKYEEAARRGAVGCIILHTTPTAGYGWEVVRSSWGKEDPQVKLDPGAAALAFAGWVTRASAEKALGKNLDELLAQANTRGFRAVPLNLSASGSIPTKMRAIRAANVAGIVRGSDPELSKQAVVFSAHWDHLGVGAEKGSDAIYNGAVDNATGCGILLEAARAWAALQQRPKRSAIFIAVTAEESGLRGAEFYAAKPVIPAGLTMLNVNYDSFYPFGAVKDVVVIGAERTSVYPTVEATAKRFNLKIKPDPHPEQGHYYRSDHFAFARAGVPAFSVNMGTEYWGKEETFGDNIVYEYNAKNYHQPSDEYKDNWNFAGMEQMGRFGWTIGLTIANSAAVTSWREGDEFLPARQRSFSALPR
jgi:Zn-dependent M28 family amino/carboxypeptidase